MATYKEAVEAVLKEVSELLDDMKMEPTLRTTIKFRVTQLVRLRLMSPPFCIPTAQIEKAIEEAKAYNLAHPDEATIAVKVKDLRVLLRCDTTIPGWRECHHMLEQLLKDYDALNKPKSYYQSAVDDLHKATSYSPIIIELVNPLQALEERVKMLEDKMRMLPQ